jgi:hypothetical protein
MWTALLSPRPKTGTGRPRLAKLVLKFGPVANTATSTRPASSMQTGGRDFREFQKPVGSGRTGPSLWSNASMVSGSGIEMQGATPSGHLASAF